MERLRSTTTFCHCRSIVDAGRNDVLWRRHIRIECRNMDKSQMKAGHLHMARSPIQLRTPDIWSLYPLPFPMSSKFSEEAGTDTFSLIFRRRGPSGLNLSAPVFSGICPSVAHFPFLNAWIASFALTKSVQVKNTNMTMKIALKTNTPTTPNSPPGQ